MDEWILVLDEGDSLSDEQLAVCQSLKPALKGALVCKQRAEAGRGTCKADDAIPCDCFAQKAKEEAGDEAKSGH